MTELTDALLRGPRGRRLCLEYVVRTDEAVRSAVFSLGRERDPSPGVLFHAVVGDVAGGEVGPSYTGDDVAMLVDAVDLTSIQMDIVRESLHASVDLARYWQEPDGEDAVAPVIVCVCARQV